MYVVIPCYNEEQMLPITAKALIKKLDELKAEGRIAQNSKVMFVDDGSKDKTWEIIQKLHEASPVFTGLKLSRNKGHQNALLAGLMTARNYADIVVSKAEYAVGVSADILYAPVPYMVNDEDVVYVVAQEIEQFIERKGYRFQAWNCSGILQAFGAYGR